MASLENRQAEFIDLLLKAARWARVNFDNRVKTYGLTLARARALLSLLRASRLNQKALAEELGIEHATLVRLLDALEQQGLVVRDVAEGDRRANTLSLTEEGTLLAKKVEKVGIEIRAEVCSGINADELEQGIAILRHLSQTIGRGE